MKRPYTIHVGDCREVLAMLPEQHFHCCVTSPPYFGLRDYGVDGQIGLEPTPDDFVAAMVEVFRGVWRVLRDDGVLWLNLGSSYASGCKGVSDLGNIIKSLCKGGIVRIMPGDTLALAAKGEDILLGDHLPPNLELRRLLGVKRVFVKHGNNDFRKVFDGVESISNFCISTVAAGFIVDYSGPDLFLDIPDGGGVVCTQVYLRSKSAFDILPTLPHESNQTPLAIKEPAEPCAECRIGGAPIWDTVSGDPSPERFSKINAVDNAVPLADGLGARLHLSSDFRVTKSSDEQLALSLVNGCVGVVFGCVSHVYLHDGDGLCQYGSLYTQAIRKQRTRSAKQELGIPDLACRALMEDGWICRDRIIWAKPAPMPGSQRDRCTSSYEFVFQLTKKPRYFFDLEAVKEPNDNPATIQRYKYGFGGPKNEHIKETTNPTYVTGNVEYKPTRTPRNVWKIAHEGFSGAHFATFPRELPMRCIKASTSEKGCCPACGAPWVRVVERGKEIPLGHANSRKAIELIGEYRGESSVSSSGMASNTTRETQTIGWEPGCGCEDPDPSTFTHILPPVPCRVLDPFGGAGTTAIAACLLGRECDLIELNQEYADLAESRIAKELKPSTARTDNDEPAPLFSAG